MDINNSRIDYSKIDTLCLSGGGNKVFTFLGALNYLLETNKIKMEQFDHFYGTSGGALISYFFVLGYTIDEIIEFLYKFDFFKCVRTEFNLDNLLNNFGLNDGNRFKYVVISVLKYKYNIEDITLIDLYNLTKKELVILGTNYTDGIETIFSYKTTPNISIITAIRISVSIPFLFTPVLYEGKYYVDGGITNNFPFNWCNQDTTLGIFIKASVKNELNNLFDLYFGCFDIMFDTVVDKIVKDYKNVITIINTPAMLEKGFSDFDLDVEYKKYILGIGYNCAKLWASNNTTL
jgi:predicted acylesterase/phospholipase RssA